MARNAVHSKVGIACAGCAVWRGQAPRQASDSEAARGCVQGGKAMVWHAEGQQKPFSSITARQ
ncbi:hypothetical protein XbrCFBP1976_11635 [Xanthomonas bromi]|uniref:Uncharacterized protein n=1 Tax=Xanthomonas bromi TaxID=56449 RepID=A0ABX5BSV6_9XANT|nr:hypothetical protein XbrCFBP1976_11635 [Xanthomonas bromi]